MMGGEFSGTRLYLGNLPRDVTKREVEDFFKQHGNGNIVEVKLMNGFGFIQYDNEEDPKDIVPAYHGREFKGQRLTVQFARGNRHAPRENTFAPDTRYPRTRRTQFRMNITGLQPDTSWQDLKDFARRSNVDVVFSEVSRDGRGMVEFETHDDLREAVAKLDGTEFKGNRVTCIAEVTDVIPPPMNGGGRGSGGRYRSRSPPPHRRYSPGPPRERGGGYSPPRRRDYSPRRDYRDRSPRREAYSSYERAPRDEPRSRYSPPRRGGGGPPPPVDDGRRGPQPPVDDMGPVRGGRMSPRGGGGGRSPPRYYSGGGSHRDDDYYYSRRR
ncbi:pre-mRNA splicing factor [Tirmania nivea]|nr:pre-mRNA splicing factor [Tirmania nivea]